MSYPRLTTAEQFFANQPASRCELVNGVVHMMSPAGGGHGRIAVNVAVLLDRYVRGQSIGRLYGAETGFIISTNPDTVRAPDAAFVKQSRLAEIIDESKFLPFAPTLAVEIISPSDSFIEVEAKAQDWLSSGCELVLLLDPRQQRVHVMRSVTHSDVLSANQSLDLSNLIPNCIIPVAQLFE